MKKKMLDHLAVEAIIKDGRSFNDLNKIGLKTFIENALPGKNQKTTSFIFHHRDYNICQVNVFSVYCHLLFI